MNAIVVYTKALITSPFKLIKLIVTQTATIVTIVGLFGVDGVYTIGNLVLPNKRKGKVIAAGLPGYNGIWPEYIPPKSTDSRSPCPALNAMANHGILPHDGRNISTKEFATKIQQTFNTGWTFPTMVMAAIKKQFSRDVFNLEDLCAHNIIEHDASLLRDDARFQPNQYDPSLHLTQIRKVLKAIRSTASGILTPVLLSRISSIRRLQSKQQNRHFYMTNQHKFFGSANCTVMMQCMGNDYDTLKPFLEEERIPDGWEPICRSRFGFSLIEFHAKLFEVEFGVKENVPQAQIDGY
jgi:hypothetical protein